MRPIRIAGATAALAALVLSLASSAQAAGSITDNGNGSVTVVLTGSGASAEILYFCATSTPAASCDALVDLYGSLSGGTFVAGSTVFQTSPGTLVSLPAGTYNLGLAIGSSVTTSQANVVIGGGGGSSSSSGSSPASVTQQFGKPASGTCDAAQPAGLDWAGVPSGGWAHSWSQWMNAGTGGFVCTRTLVYRTSQGTWVLA